MGISSNDDDILPHTYLSLAFLGQGGTSKSVANKTATTWLYTEREKILIVHVHALVTGLVHSSHSLPHSHSHINQNIQLVCWRPSLGAAFPFVCQQWREKGAGRLPGNQ